MFKQDDPPPSLCKVPTREVRSILISDAIPQTVTKPLWPNHVFAITLEVRAYTVMVPTELGHEADYEDSFTLDAQY
jgi:hypothetical protein